MQLQAYQPAHQAGLSHCLYEEIEALAARPCLFEHTPTPWGNLVELRRAKVGRDFVEIPKGAVFKDVGGIVKSLAAVLSVKAKSGSKASVFLKDPSNALETTIETPLLGGTFHPKRLALFVKRTMVFPLYGRPKKLSDAEKAHMKKIDAGKLDIVKVDGGYKLTLSGMKG